jgi:hypothetical protein
MMISSEKLVHFVELRRVEGTLLLTHLHLYMNDYHPYFRRRRKAQRRQETAASGRLRR